MNPTEINATNPNSDIISITIAGTQPEDTSCNDDNLDINPESVNRLGECSETMIMRDSASAKRLRRKMAYSPYPRTSSACETRDIVKVTKTGVDATSVDGKTMINRSKKVFVGGLSATTNAEDLSEYFSQFGKVQESMLLFDKQTNRHRGFAFVTFETEDAAEMVVKKHFHEIKSKIVECKVAQPKEIMMGTPARTPRTRPVLAPGAYPYTPVDPTTAYLLNIGNLTYQRAPSAATHYAAYPHSYTIPGTIGGGGFSFVDPQTTAIYHPSLQLAPSPVPAQTQTLYANDMATAAAVASLARANAAAALGVPQQAAGARIEQFNANQALGQIQAGALTNGDIKRDLFATMLSSYNATAQGALASYPAVSNARALAAAAAGTAASTGAEPLLAAATADPNVGAHYINCTNSQTGYSANIPASLAGHLATPGAALITGLTYQ